MLFGSGATNLNHMKVAKHRNTMMQSVVDMMASTTGRSSWKLRRILVGSFSSGGVGM